MWNSLCIATHRRCFSSVGTAAELIAGSSDFDAWWKQEIFSFPHLSRQTLESSKPPSKRVPWLIIFGEGGKTVPGFDHRPRSCTEIKNERSYTSTPPSAHSYFTTGRFFTYLYCHAFFILLCYLVFFFFLSSTTLWEFWLAQLFLSMVSFPVPSVSNYLLPSSSNRLSRHHPILILVFLSVLLRVVSIYKCF